MELQVSLDVLDLEDAIRIAGETIDLADRLEVGTLLMRRYGMTAVEVMRRRFELATIVADCKIMDCGAEETEMAIDAGADVVTVMAAAPAATIAAVCRKASGLGARTIVDTLGVADLSCAGANLEPLPFEFLLLHRGRDEQQADYRLPLQNITDLPPARIGIAGSLTADSLTGLLDSLRPQLVVVGQGIVGVSDPRAAAADIRAVLNAATSYSGR